MCRAQRVCACCASAIDLSGEAKGDSQPIRSSPAHATLHLHPWPFYLYSFRRAHLFNPLASLLPPIMIIPDSDDKTSVKSSHDKSMAGPPPPASEPDQVSEVRPIKARPMINLPHRALPHTAPFLVKAHPRQSPRKRSLSISIFLQTSPR